MKQYYKTYRAYKELLDKLEGEPFLKSLIRSYCTKAARKGDEFSGQLSQREIDTDWLEAIEGGLRYIDQAIRENRRFIVTEEEIVPIERARKITSESIRHLAQHSSLISKVENGFVTPEKILNVEKEETFIVYENRFIRTLVLELIRFVDRVIEKIGKIDDYVNYSVKLDRKFKSKSDKINLKFEYEYEQLQPTSTENNIEENVSGKSEIERVFRVKKILTDFMGTALMKALVGAEPVRPPVVQTNVMKQNVAFKKAYELYSFIMSYRKPGYSIVMKSGSDMFSKNTNTSLTTMFYLTDFALAINASEVLAKRLHRAYEVELKKEQNKAAVARQMETDEWNDKIDDAVRNTREEHQLRIDELTEELERYKSLYEEYFSNFTTTSVAHEELKSKYAVQETKFYDELEMVKGDYESQIAELQRVNTEIIEHKDREFAEQTEKYERELTQQRLYIAQKIVELDTDKKEALSQQAEKHKSEIAKMQELRSQELQKEKEYWENRVTEAVASSENAWQEKSANFREQMMRILNTTLYVRGLSNLLTEDRMDDVESFKTAFLERRSEIELRSGQESEKRTIEAERERYEKRLRNFDEEYSRTINAYRDRLEELGDTTEIKGLTGYTKATGSPFAAKSAKSQPDRRYEKQDKAIAVAMRKYVMETRPYVNTEEPEGVLFIVDNDSGVSEKDFTLYETQFVPGSVTEDNADEFFSVFSNAVKSNKLVVYVGPSSKIRPNCDIVFKFAKELRLKNLTVLDTENVMCGVSVLLGKLTELLSAGVSLIDAFALLEDMKKSLVSVYLTGKHPSDRDRRARTVKYNGYADSREAVIELRNGLPEIMGIIRGGFAARIKAFFSEVSSRLSIKATSNVYLWTCGLDVEDIAAIKQMLTFECGFRNIRIMEDSDSATATILGDGSFGITYLVGEREIDKFVRHATKRPQRAESNGGVNVYADEKLLPKGRKGAIKAVLPFEGGFFGSMNALRKTIKDDIKGGSKAIVLAPQGHTDEYLRAAGIVSRTFECAVEIMPIHNFMGFDCAAMFVAERIAASGGGVESLLRAALMNVTTLVVVGERPNRSAKEALLSELKLEYTGGAWVIGMINGKKKYRKFKEFDINAVALAVGTLLGETVDSTFVMTGSEFGTSAMRIISELKSLDGDNDIAPLALADTPDFGRNVAAIHVFGANLSTD